jgi:hypothetical protein
VRVVVEAVVGIYPAVEADGEVVGHAVRVARAVGAEELLLLVGPAVAVGVGELADVVDREDERAAFDRQDAERDVEPFGERLDLPRRPSSAKSDRTMTLSRGRGASFAAVRVLDRCW